MYAGRRLRFPFSSGSSTYLIVQFRRTGTHTCPPYSFAIITRLLPPVMLNFLANCVPDQLREMVEKTVGQGTSAVVEHYTSPSHLSSRRRHSHPATTQHHSHHYSTSSLYWPSAYYFPDGFIDGYKTIPITYQTTIDQTEGVAYHSQRGIDHLEKFGVFLKDRAIIEDEYASKLRALVKKNLPKRKEDDDLCYSSERSFHGLLHELESLAAQHEVVSDRFRKELQPSIATICSDLKQRRKAYLTELQQLQNRLNGSVEHMAKCQKAYLKAFKEAETTALKYDKAEKNMDLSRAELERAKNNAIGKQQQCHVAKQTYAHSLQLANEQQHRHYVEDLPAVLEKLRLLDESRIDHKKQCMQSSVKVEADLMHIIQRCYDDMLAIVDNLDPRTDSLLVVQRFRSGYTHPCPFPFEDLGAPDAILTAETSSQNGLMTNGNASTFRRPKIKSSASLVSRKHSMHRRFFGHKNEYQEDFSNHPPQQQCRNLESKLETIMQEMDKKTQSRDGLLKMQNVYRDNPKMGNLDHVQQELSVVNRELDGLHHEGQKFQINCTTCYLRVENYLTEARCQLNTPHPSAIGYSPRVHPQSKLPMSDRPSSSTSSSSMSKTRSLPPDLAPPQRASYSDDSLSSDGSAMSTHRDDEQKSAAIVTSTTTTAAAAAAAAAAAMQSSSASPESGFDFTDNSTVRLDASEGRSVYNECDPLPTLGTALAIYQFDAQNDGMLHMDSGEELLLLEKDEGDGWTRVKKLNRSTEGFVPTSYLDCKWYPD